MKSSMTHAVNGKYIREWLVLGPFFPDDLDTDFLVHVGGEASIEPKEGDAVTTTDGRTLKWERYESGGDVINLLNAVGKHDHATAYAFCVLQSETAGDAQVRLGNDDRAMVWINGRPVHSNPGGGPVALDSHLLEVDLKSGLNRCLIKVTNRTEAWGFAMRILPPSRAVISGIITDERGETIPWVNVRLEQDGKEIAQMLANVSGGYRLDIYPVRGPYDLSAASSDLGDWQLGIELVEGERRELNLKLREAISIQGTLLMLDDATPHVAVPVQSIRDGEVTATQLSDERGEYRFVNLRPGVYQVRCQILGGCVYYGEEKTRKPESQKARASFLDKKLEQNFAQAFSKGLRSENGVMEEGQEDSSLAPSLSGRLLQVDGHKTYEDINFRFPPLKKGAWRHYTVIDGLATMSVHDIQQDPGGVLWFASCSTLNGIGSGVSRYDGKEFVSLTTKDGLLSNSVWSIHSAPGGVMWFGMRHGGVSRYDGQEFVNFTTKDGLAGNSIWAIHCDLDGAVWFGTGGAGIFRYDGKEFANFTTEDGLPSDLILCIHRDPDGTMWFGTDGGGVSRYDGKEFVNFTTEDGLVSNAPIVIHRDPDGVMWFGTGYPGGGLSRYDGQEFVNFTTKDGLAHNRIWDIYCDHHGVLWLATDEGVSRYDGRGFVNFTTADGLLYNMVEAIHCDPDGGLWFGTALGGVSRYDEESFITFTKEDGLPNNVVQAIHLGPNGVMWLGTADGLARYDGDSMGIGSPIALTPKDDPISGPVSVIHSAPDGTLWFGMGFLGSSRGVFRYDSADDSSVGSPTARKEKESEPSLANFTTADGLAGSDVRAIYSTPDGMMWFGTHDGGVSCYDGKEFVNFTTEDGLVSNEIYAIHCDSHGVMWFGTFPGVLRYDGKEFVNLTTEDGLADDLVFAIYDDPDGVLWFGTFGGVSRYHGKEFVNFTTEDGLSSNMITAIHRTPDGLMWFGTLGGGVSGYDGTAWTSLDTRDGLADNRILSIESDADGNLWFATMDGLTRYRRSETRPRIHIVSITTDQTYRPKTQDSRLKTEEPSIPAFATATRVTIEYSAIDFKTLPEKRQYRCRISSFEKSLSKGEYGGGRPRYEARDLRLESRDVKQESLESQVSSLKSEAQAYNPPTRGTSFDWTPEKPGAYIFEVQAIDRDLNYSEPATVKLKVVADPHREQIARLESDLEKRNRELERANAELQRLSNFKSELLSMVSHELRTPLTSIDGFTRLIHERFLTDDLIAKCNEETRPTIQRVKDRVAIVQENTSRLARLINDLLDFSRIERGRELEMHFARMELSDVIENVISTYRGPASEKGVTLEYGGDLPLHAGQLEVYGDSDRLAQVLSNLVSNAVKFTPEGGSITIGAQKIPPAPFSKGGVGGLAPFSKGGEHKGMIELRVQDTGVGIHEELLPTIFEPFEQAGAVDVRKSGTGLGLAIVRHIIDRHNGTVRVESEEGVGSTFIITLSEYAAIPEVVRRGIQRILIVDDDYDILRLLEEGLSEYPNTHIITATSSSAAFQILEQQSCDVMITDVRMPGDISGIELASQVQEKYPDLKVFVMTNTPEEKERVTRLEANWIDKAMPNLIHYIAKKIGKALPQT